MHKTLNGFAQSCLAVYRDRWVRILAGQFSCAVWVGSALAMAAPRACLDGVDFRWILAALRRNGAISIEDERLLLAECESLNGSCADSARAPGSSLNDAEYWSLRFVHDLSDALHRSGWIDGAPHAARCADDLVLADHAQALCARLASGFATR